MSYCFEGRIRYSEIGENGCLTLPGILNYFQDCCTFHSEAAHQGMESLKQRQRVWVLSSWQVVLHRYPKFGEKVKVTTFPYEFRGFLGYRNFIMETEEGERLAWANSIWTYLDLKTGIPRRLAEEDTRGYEPEEKLDMEYAPRKIQISAPLLEQERFQVQKHHLDTNHHVNNCQYIQMASDFLPEDFVIHQMRAEYKKSAMLHNTVVPCVAKEPDKILVSLNDEQNQPYAVVEFTQKGEE